MKISPYFSSLCNMSCLFSVTVYFSYFLFTFWKFVCLLFRNLFMWDVSNQMKLNLRLKWIKTELCTKSIIWDFWKMFESDELDLLTGSMNSKNIPNFQTFPNFWKIELRTPKFYFEDFQFKFFSRQDYKLFLQRYKMLSERTWPNFRGSEQDGVKILVNDFKLSNDVTFGK